MIASGNIAGWSGAIGRAAGFVSESVHARAARWCRQAEIIFAPSSGPPTVPATGVV